MCCHKDRVTWLLTISTSHTEPLGSCKSTMLLGDHKDKGLYEFSIGLYAIISESVAGSFICKQHCFKLKLIQISS